MYVFFLVPKNKELYVTCQVGHRGYLAVKMLQNFGYKKVINLTGGYKLYSDAKKSYEMKNNKTTNLNSNNKGSAVKMSNQTNNEKVVATITVDACGLQCPGPILETKKKVDSVNDGDVLKVLASDPGFAADIDTWCEKTCNELISVEMKNGTVEALIRKGNANDACEYREVSTKKATTMVAFSGDFDKAMASLIIANGSAAMGHKVTIFYTFWGLNILRKHKKQKVKKSVTEKMFGKMMPRGTKKLKLSQMNMGGAGTKMIKGVMKKKNVNTLEELLQQALDLGVEMIACTMSMDLMGIKEEELLDGVTFGGVAKYIGEASGSAVTLFI